MEPMFTLPRRVMPPAALMLSARWSDASGWTIVAAARSAGEGRWARSLITNGSALTVDELLEVCASLLEASIERS